MRPSGVDMATQPRRVWNRTPSGSLDDITLTDLDGGPTSATEWEPVAATLECKQGPDAGRVHVLYTHGVVLGRALDCDLRLTDVTVSRNHAAITRQGNSYVLSDLDSGNHTFVDGARVTGTAALGRTCRLRLGKHTAIDFTMVDEIGLEEVYDRLHGERCQALAQQHDARASTQAEELRAMVRDLDLFTRSAAHDLRSPLQGLLLNLDVLLESGPVRADPDVRDNVEEALDTIHRMEVLLRDLTAYTRVRRAGYTEEIVDLESVMVDVLSNLRAPIRQTGADVRVETVPREAVGNRSLLVLLLQNLVGNAIKFHGDVAPRVLVTSAPVAGAWEIAVRDNGIGIPAGRVGDVFQPFERLQARGRYEGSGLGLAIVERIVQLHGGEIRVESREGWGSTFAFTLPIADDGRVRAATTLDTED